MNPNLIDWLPRSPGLALAADVVVKATLILAASAAVATALRRSSASTRHLAWCVGLGAATALPAFSLALPGWSWRVLPAAAEAAPPTMAQAPPGHSGFSRPIPDPSDEIDLGEADPLAAATARPSSRPAPIVPSDTSAGWLAPSWSWLWAAWLAGVAAVLSAPVAGRIALRRWARQAEPIVGDDWSALLADLSTRLGLSRRVRLLHVDRDAMPMTWGWMRPVILLPAEADSWGTDRRRDVLLHELAHVRRLDGPTQTMARVACALYWFHPMAWIAERRMRIERERACDDVVLLAGARASDYAGHLLEIARGLRTPRSASLAAPAMARPSQLEGRLRAILDPARRRGGPGRRAATVALLAAVSLLVPMATLRVGARASAPAVDPIADPAGRMSVVGRVLDPDGRPVPGASVMVHAAPRHAARGEFERRMPVPIGRATSDGSGGFWLDAERTTSARHQRFGAVAMAPGFGAGWVELDPDADRPSGEIRLRPEQVIEGRILDPFGRPIVGVRVEVHSMGRVVPPALGGRIEETTEGPNLWWSHGRERPGWPGPSTSDADGRFSLRGIGRGLRVTLGVDDPRFARSQTAIDTDGAPGPKTVSIALEPARVIAGRVTDAETGEPIPHAHLVILSYKGNTGLINEFDADDEGRFRMNPLSADRYSLYAAPPPGRPYLAFETKPFAWPRGAIEHRVDVALQRGAVIQGRVVEEGTGRPVAGARVSFAGRRAPEQGGALDGSAVTEPDGSFRIAARPAPGYLLVLGPSDDYVYREIDYGAVREGRPGGRRYFAHALVAHEPKAGAESPEVTISIRRGVSVAGRVIGPDDRPIPSALMISRVFLPPNPGAWQFWRFGHSGRVRDGRFEVHGLDPEAEVPIHFFDPDNRLGATANLSGRSGSDGPVTVRLGPCGAARARLVDPDGKPVAGFPGRRLIAIIVTPGSSPFEPNPSGRLRDDSAGFAVIDPGRYENLVSDADGRIVLPDLIPGATYRVSTRGQDRRPLFQKDLTVQPGEMVDLGDVLIERP